MTLTNKTLLRELKTGEHITLSSDDHTLEAWLDADGKWSDGFKIWFNGTLVHTSKTFKSFENKFNELVEKHNLVREA